MLVVSAIVFLDFQCLECDSGIEGILITNPSRAARQQASQPVWHAVDMGREPDLTAATIYTPSINDVDLADSYVPFEPPQAPGADSINTERMLGSAFAVILVAGFIFGLLLLGNLVAHGNAIPSLKGVNYAQQGK